MADPLAETLNRISANPQSAEVAPTAPAFSWQTIAKAALRLNPMTMPLMIGNDLAEGKFIENQRTQAGQIAQIPTDIVSGLISLPSLPDTVSQLMGGDRIMPQTSDAVVAASEPVRGLGRTLGNAIAGREMDNSLLYGNNDAELAGSWQRLLGSAIIPAPPAWAVKVAQGASALKTGVGIVDKTGEIALKTLEALTPIAVTTKPTTKVIAANAAVASTLGAGLEGILGPTTTVAEAKQLVDEKAKGTLDVAAAGGTEIQRNEPRLIQAGLTGDPVYDAIGIGLGAAGALGFWKRDLISKTLLGARDSIRKRVTGYDPRDPTEGTLQSTMTMLDQQGANRNAGMEQSLRKALKTKGYTNANDIYDQFREITASRSGPSVNTRMQALYNEGRFPDSAVRVNPVNDWFTQYRTLDDAERTLLDQALHSQRELDTRQIDKIRFNLYNTSSKDLADIVKQVNGNQKLKPLYDDFHNTMTQMSKYLDEQKRFTSKEIKLFMAKNPHFVPERLTKMGDESPSYLSQRNIQKDGGLDSFEKLGSPAEFLPKYLDEAVRSSEGKKIQRDFLNLMIDEKYKGNAYASQIIGRHTTEPPSHNAAGLYVHWRNSYGESQWTEIKDAVVRNSLRDSTNPTTLQLTNGAISAVTRFYEKGAVGSLAAVTGNVFAPTSALYNRTFGSALRPEGVAFSRLDKHVQDFTEKLTGKRIGVPGDWITPLPEDAMRAAQNVSAVMAHRISRIMHNSMLTDGNINKMLGPTTTKAWADALDRVFKRSAVYDMQQRGLLGPASYMSIDPAQSYKNAKQMLEGHNVFVGADSFLGDILHAISSAPAMTVKAINETRVPDWKLNSALRNMTGDPAQSGAFKNAKGIAEATNATPWGNIFIQSTTQFARNIRKNPTGAAMGVFNGVAIPAIGSTMWNASLGPEYSDYQFNIRTPDKQAANFYIGIPGKPPEMGIEIGLDPLMRWFKWGAEVTAGAHLGALDGTLHKPENAVLHTALSDMVNHRQFGMNEGSVPRSLAQQTFIPPVMPAIQTGAAALGVRMRSYDDARIINERAGSAGFTEGFKASPHADIMGHHAPSTMEDIVRGIGSQAAGNIYKSLVDTKARIEGTGDVKSALGAQGQAWKQRVADSTKMLGSGPLFDTFLAISPSTESNATLVKEKLDGMKKIIEAFEASTLPGGTPQTVLGGKRGFQEYAGATPQGAPDLQTMQLAEQAKRMYGELSNAILSQNKIEFDQRTSIQNSTRFSPEMKRALMNEHAFKIIENNRRALMDIQRYEAVLSQQFGRNIKFDTFRLGRGMDQQR